MIGFINENAEQKNATATVAKLKEATSETEMKQVETKSETEMKQVETKSETETRVVSYVNVIQNMKLQIQKLEELIELIKKNYIANPYDDTKKYSTEEQKEEAEIKGLQFKYNRLFKLYNTLVKLYLTDLEEKPKL